MVLLAALYLILKPVNRNLALVAAFSSLVFALMWSVTALSTLGAKLLTDTSWPSVREFISPRTRYIVPGGAGRG